MLILIIVLGVYKVYRGHGGRSGTIPSVDQTVGEGGDENCHHGNR